MTAVIYARYFSDNQREESIEGQIRDWLNEKGVKNQRGGLMTFNTIQHKEGTQTVTFGEAAKVASEGNGSDLLFSSEKQRSLALKKQSVPPAGTLCFSL